MAQPDAFLRLAVADDQLWAGDMNGLLAWRFKDALLADVIPTGADE